VRACVRVCSSVQNFCKSYKLILMNFIEAVERGPTTKLLDFGGDRIV